MFGQPVEDDIQDTIAVPAVASQPQTKTNTARLASGAGNQKGKGPDF